MPGMKLALKKVSTDDVGQIITDRATPSAADDPGKPDFQRQAINAALIGAGKNILISGTQKYFDITGNYVAATAFSEALGVVSDVATLATGLPGIIAVSAKKIIGAAGSFIETWKSNYEIEKMRTRAGEISMRGSRYGDD